MYLRGLARCVMGARERERGREGGGCAASAWRPSRPSARVQRTVRPPLTTGVSPVRQVPWHRHPAQLVVPAQDVLRRAPPAGAVPRRLLPDSTGPDQPAHGPPVDRGRERLSRHAPTRGSHPRRGPRGPQRPPAVRDPPRPHHRPTGHRAVRRQHRPLQRRHGPRLRHHPVDHRLQRPAPVPRRHLVPLGCRGAGPLRGRHRDGDRREAVLHRSHRAARAADPGLRHAGQARGQDDRAARTGGSALAHSRPAPGFLAWGGACCGQGRAR